MLISILTTVLGGLSVAAILGFFKTHWLYGIVPKLYFVTPLSNGRIVSIGVFNGGFRSEEDVTICIRSTCKFELIASSKSAVITNQNVISLGTVAKSENVTVFLLIENAGFDIADIERIESKATRAKLVERKEQVAPIWQHIIAIPVLFLCLILPLMFGTVVGAEMKISLFKYISNQFEEVIPSKQLAGFKTVLKETGGNQGLFGLVDKKKLAIKLGEIIRRKDILSFSVEVANNTSKVIMVEGYYETTAGDRGQLDFWDSRFEKVGLMPGEKKEFKLKVFLPEELSVKAMQGNYTFTTLDTDKLYVDQTVQF